MIASALSNMFPGLRSESKSRDPTDDFWYSSSPMLASSAGVTVNDKNAMAVSAVFACVRLLSETLASLPFRIYEQVDERTTELAEDHELWSLLHSRPNRWQTSMEWREMGMSHLCLRGNFYNQIYIDRFGKTELIPLSPERMHVETQADGTPRYVYYPKEGGREVYGVGEILHIRGLTLDGMVGVSVLEYARNAIGSAIAQETHGASLFKNGGLPAFWISRPAGMNWSKEAKENFRSTWRKIHGGPENAGNPPILGDGMELKELGITNRDAQWIESQSFSGVQICRFFRVPPHLVGYLDRATFSNIEQQSIEFVVYTMRPWAVRWEQSCNRDLLDLEEPYFTKIALEGLLRGDIASRYSAYNVAIQGGWMLPNEARAYEDLNPIEGGDTPRFPMNMQPAGSGPDSQQQSGQTAVATGDEPRPDEEAAARRAFSIVLQDNSTRIALMEISALSLRAEKAAGDRKKWAAFVRDTYAKQEPYIKDRLGTIRQIHAEITGADSPVDYNAFFTGLYKSSFALLAKDADVPAILSQWKATRPAEILNLLQEVFDVTH